MVATGYRKKTFAVEVTVIVYTNPLSGQSYPVRR